MKNPVTVKELKAQLADMPDDLVVTVSQTYVLLRGDKFEGSEVKQVPVTSVEKSTYWKPNYRANAKTPGKHIDCVKINYGEPQ